MANNGITVQDTPLDQWQAQNANNASVVDTPTLPAWARILGGTASNFGKGLATTAGLPGDLVTMFNRGTNFVGNKIREGITGQPTPPDYLKQQAEDDTGWFNSDWLQQQGRQAGLFDRPDLAPQSTAERYLYSAARGAGSAAPFGPRAIPSGIGAGLGEEATRELLPDLTKAHPILAPLIGSTLGAIGGGGVTNTIGRINSSLRGSTTPLVADYDLLGMKPRLAGDVTGSNLMQRLQAFASKAPGGAPLVEHAANQTLGEYGNAIDDTAAMLGSSRTLTDAGRALKNSTTSWLSNFRTQSDANYKALDQFIPGTTPVKVTNLKSALDSVVNAMPDAPNVAGRLQSGFVRGLKTDLDTDLAKTNGALAWSTVKQIRTRIGEYLSSPNGLPADVDTAELKRIYSGLTQDMQGAASAAGQKASDAFAAANTYTKNGHDFIDRVLQPIADAKTPEDAAAAVLNKGGRGGTVLQEIRDQMPRAADELGAYSIRDMGAATAGNQNAAGNAVSSASFLTDLNKMSPEAKAALFQDPAVKARLASLARVSKGMKDTERFVNSSNTATHTGTKELMGLGGQMVGGGVLGLEAGERFGHPLLGAAMGAAAPVFPRLGGYFAGRLTATPALTRFLAAPTAGRIPISGNAASIFATLPPSQQQALLGGQQQ